MNFITQPFYNPRPYLPDLTGKMITNGRLVFFEPGSTSVYKTIYLDRDLSVPANNPQDVALSRSVQGTLFLGNGFYDIYLYDDNNVEVWKAFNIPGSVEFGANVASLSMVDTIDDLRNATPGFSQYVIVGSYYASPLDMGGGLMRWNGSSTDVDDGGSIFAPEPTIPTGRWERVWQYSGYVLGDQFGFVPGVLAGEGNLISANQYCASNGTGLYIRSGQYTLAANVVLSGPYHATFDGAVFNSVTGATLGINTQGLTITQEKNMRLNSLELQIFTKQDEISPIWWGAVGDNNTDDYSAFIRLTAGNFGGNAVRIAKPYRISGIGSPSFDQITLASVNFYQGGLIRATYSDVGKIYLGPINSTSSVYYNLIGDDGLSVFAFFDRKISMRRFFNVTSNRIQITTATFDDLKTSHPSKTLVFDGYDYAHNATTSNITNRCLIDPGSVIYSSGLRNLGFIEAHPEQLCFATESINTNITIQNRLIYAPWYGIQSGDETANLEFLAMSTPSQKTIDFCGRDINVAFEENKTIGGKFKNGKITSVGVGYLLFSGGSSFQNFEFDGNISYRSSSVNKFVNCIFYTFTKGDFTSSIPVNAQFVNCEIFGNMNFLATENLKLNGDKMKFANCDFSGLVTFESVLVGGFLDGLESDLEFVNCEFTHDDTQTTANTQFIYSRIQNCKFSDQTSCVLLRKSALIGSYAKAVTSSIGGVVIELEQTGSSKSEMGISVIGNYLGQVYIDTGEISDPDTLVYGVNISNNYFEPSGVAADFDPIRIGFLNNLADYGHDCVIGKNTTRPGIGVISSTYGRGSISANATLDTSKVILPKVETTSTKAFMDVVTIVDSTP